MELSGRCIKIKKRSAKPFPPRSQTVGWVLSVTITEGKRFLQTELIFTTKSTKSTKNEPKILENPFVPFVSLVVKCILCHRGDHLFPT